MRFFEFTNEEAAGVGIVTKQNATADVPVGGEYMNVKKLFPKKKKKQSETIAYEDAFQELDSSTKIYVDMDGVLADFFGEWKKLTGKDWREIGKDELEPALGKIRDTDGFWLKLPLTSNAKSLLSLIKQVKGEYYILSSPLAGDPKAEPHKREWVEKNLDFFPPAEVIITHNKEKYAQNPDGTPNILIDDYGVNIDKWEGAGGIGFKHKDHKFERTADKLKAAIADSRDYFIDSIRKYIVENFAESTLNEYRNALYDFVKSKFPSWPEYVLRDFLYAQSKGIRDQQELKDFLERNQKDFGQVKWRLEKLPIALDIFTPKTQRMIKQREGGRSNPNQVPRDAQRHALQQRMIQQKGVSPEPIIVAKLSNGYDLIEGWHRTIQHLQAYPEGYTGPAWVGYGATYTSESMAENFADGKKPGRKGLAKRSGVNTKASVSSLRKTAKNSSGEKQRMAHWLANMKAGKAKKGK